MIQALELHGAGGAVKVFTPIGENRWELEIMTARGPEPGGHWVTADVASHVVNVLYGDE
jgi:hypothetical protein